MKHVHLAFVLLAILSSVSAADRPERIYTLVGNAQQGPNQHDFLIHEERYRPGGSQMYRWRMDPNDDRLITFVKFTDENFSEGKGISPVPHIFCGGKNQKFVTIRFSGNQGNKNVPDFTVKIYGALPAPVSGSRRGGH